MLIVGQTNFIISSVDGFVMEHYTPTNNLQADILFVLNSNADIIIIQAEQAANYLESHLFGGVELMVWLRIRGVKAHIVLASWSPLQAILNSTKYGFITGAKGSTFCQLPFLPSSSELIELFKEQSEVKNFRMYLSSLFDKIKFRHREANWWGVKSLWDVHNSIYNLSDTYPVSIEVYLRTLNNNIAKELFSYDEELVKKGLTDVLYQNRKNRIIEIDIQTVGLSKEMAISKNLKRNLSTGSKKDDNIVNLHENNIQRIEEPLVQLSKEKTIAENTDADTKEQLETCIEEIKIANPQLLYIDDNAKNGWEEILQKMLPGLPIDSIVPVNKYKDNIAGLYRDVVKPKLIQTAYTLVILDLRLFDETDVNINPEKLSGSLLLQQIKTDFPHIPVLIVTASNKRLSYSTLIHLGADAFWTKEGIDEQKTAADSVTNYMQLISHIKKLHSKEYQYLTKLTVALRNCNDNCWWCNHTWKNGDITNCNIDSVTSILQQSVNLYKNYLNRFFIEKESRDEEAVFFLTSLINKFGLIVEVIHRFDEQPNYRNFVDINYPKRKDNYGNKLRSEFRNKASHISSLSLTKETFFDVIDVLEKYLLIGNEIEFKLDRVKLVSYANNKMVVSKDSQEYTISWTQITQEMILAILISNTHTVKIDTESNSGKLILNNNISIPWATGTTAKLKGQEGYLINKIFGKKDKIFKLNKILAEKIKHYPNDEISCIYNARTNCWELQI